MRSLALKIVPTQAYTTVLRRCYSPLSKHRSNLDRIIYPITGYTGGIIDPINDWLTEGGWRIILGDDQGGLLQDHPPDIQA